MSESEELFASFMKSLGLPVDPDTPGRVVAAMREMTGGYCRSPEQILSKTFACPDSPLVSFDGIDFTALCEHHVLPFSGTAKIEYKPAGKVVGLSKMARLVDCYARRLTLQERMTNEIIGSIVGVLKPLWARVTLRAKHGCIQCRGIKQKNMSVTTTAERGSRDSIGL